MGKLKVPFGVMLFELMLHEPERGTRTQFYPLLAGLGPLLGWRLRWSALQVPYDPTLQYTLKPRQLGLLLAEVRRFKPEVLVVNEQLRGEQLAALAAVCRVIYCPLEIAKDFPIFAEFVRRIRDEKNPLLDDPLLIDRIKPDFRRKILNPMQRKERPLIRVIAGRYCDYATRAADNPFYRGLKLPAKALNCAFCECAVVKRPGMRCMRDPLAFAARQIEGACRDRGGDGVIRFELSGSELWRRLELLLHVLMRRGIRNAELVFMPRLDELLEKQDVLARCLPLLAAHGLCLRIYGMGVENFSPVENLRLNKGITAEQVHQAAAFIAATNSRWPRQFPMPQGGLSMILFTPWTRLEDLRCNIDNIARCPMIDHHFALGRRLQLLPERPITKLAEHDGLLVKRWDDPFYNAGCITAADQDEIPWRFQNPPVEVLWRLARRLSSNLSKVPADDQDSLSLGAFLSARPPGRHDPLALFSEAVDVVSRHPEIGSVAALLDRLRPSRAGSHD